MIHKKGVNLFPEIEKNNSRSLKESEILSSWKQNDTINKSLSLNKDSGKTWTFYEGPPTANGKPHPGHILTRAVKDLFCRFKTMTGHHVSRKAGWDCHGLPVELEVEKELGLHGKADIEKYGMEPFINKCVESVFKNTDEWKNLTERIGYWIDLKNAYATYHQSYVESVWWSLSELYKKGLLYQGHKICPWCPHCQTSLSSHELAQGYKEVDDAAVYVKFKSTNVTNLYYLAWTTTPWTLPSNSALAVNSDADYCFVAVGDETYVIAENLVSDLMKRVKIEDYQVKDRFKGAKLIGEGYSHLFNWAGLTGKEQVRAYKIHAADFVETKTGTGIVHIAPAYGEDDYQLHKTNQVPLIQLTGTDGRFVDSCSDEIKGRSFKDAEYDLIRSLKANNQFFAREQHKHEYPHCWRCSNKLMYYARSGWFVKTSEKAHEFINNNKDIKWVPEHIKDGRFGSFLNENTDWNLSRERYWGTPLPIWKCQEDGTEEIVSSLEELKSKPNIKGLERFDEASKENPSLSPHLRIHKPWIDFVTYDSPSGGKMERVKEVIDCWYDSGAMPFAQHGFPHQKGSKEAFYNSFPADFISEAIDQTRGWFYSLLAESSLLQQTSSYKSCLVLGHVCDEKGEKMSKSKGNYIDPNLILNDEGADALRWFFYSSTNSWNNSRFAREAVRESQKEFVLKIQNVYSFFSIYANIDKYEPNGNKNDLRDNSLDNWIISELNSTIKIVKENLDEMNILSAANELTKFVDSMSNWYLRQSRSRFWSKGN